MLDRTEPYWRYRYDLPTPLLKNPNDVSRVGKGDPEAEPPRKALVPSQTRTVAHAPLPQRARWDLAHTA